jgi:phosphoglycerate dehydrogenase-like enzyme
MKPRILLALRSSLFASMFSPRDVQRLGAIADVINPAPPPDVSSDFLTAEIGAADLAITSWHTPVFDEPVVAEAARLKLVCHAGGSVRPIVTPAFWGRGLRITSAAAAISHGVAEYCLGLMLVASKRAFWLGEATRAGHWKDAGGLFGGWHEIYQQKIGIIGAGAVGWQLLMLLRAFVCDVRVYDPYKSAEQLRAVGATKVESLDELFGECLIVSLNAPLTPATTHLVRGSHLARLRPGALFINTARPQLVHPDELVIQLATGRFVACLDVTDPEPPPLDHPLRRLPNVWLTPHIAGAVAENQLRIGTLVVDEVERFAAGAPPRYAVAEADLAVLA